MSKKNDFPMLNTGVIYFDNAATSLKPKRVIDKIVEYYSEYSANASRGDYNISFKVNDEIDNTRVLVQKFINARRKEEIIFTKNTTESLNEIVFGFFYGYLGEDDEVLLTTDEHASNILPWLMLSISKKIKVKFINTKNRKLTLDLIKENITNKTKVISLAHITNVMGDKRDIKSICSYAHKRDILVVVDAAQSAPHTKIDVEDMDADFLAFSAHKMCGPTGAGVLYGKYELLKNMMPLLYGGSMNKNFNEYSLELSSIPSRFEAGTQNIAGIIGFGEAINFLNEYGLDNIERHVKYLRKYLVQELKKLSHIKIYNEDYEGSTIIINMEGVLSGDLGLYLNSKGICVRSGAHCARMIENDTVRISLYFYNTYEEIDYLIDALKDKKSIFDFIN